MGNIIGAGVTSFVESLASPTGKIILSIIWGIGLATLFRQACNGRDCIIVTSPHLSDVQGKVYKFQDKCYTYEPSARSCAMNS
jgi:hypothetical protein